MHVDPNWITVAGMACWLAGSFAFVGFAQDLSRQLRMREARVHRLAEMGELER